MGIEVMFNLERVAGVAALSCMAAPAIAAGVVVPASASCPAGPAALVRIEGLKARTGTLRVQVYAAEGDFLEKGRWLRRTEFAVPASGAVQTCVGLPAAGQYAIAVRHDVDGAGKSGWNDGGGFSRNPKLSIMKLEPRWQDVAVPVGAAPRTVAVTMNYRHGLSIGPVR
jgi:uncharacterized protein (DUF2141 family)